MLYKVFHLSDGHFQTGWFIESIATQILVIFIIRTKKTPFWKSTPGIYILISAFLVVAFAWIIPYTFLGPILSFVALPLKTLLIILSIVVVYLIVTEISKYFFYKFYPNAS